MASWLPVVLARGIDSRAHLGALEAGGATIAVLGCGVDVIYPKENAKLFDRILESGCLVSEFPCRSYPAPPNFPVRNRIISGLSLGTIITEAARFSGSFDHGAATPRTGSGTMGRAGSSDPSREFRPEPLDQARSSSFTLGSGCLGPASTGHFGEGLLRLTSAPDEAVSGREGGLRSGTIEAGKTSFETSRTLTTLNI